MIFKSQRIKKGNGIFFIKKYSNKWLKQSCVYVEVIILHYHIFRNEKLMKTFQYPSNQSILSLVISLKHRFRIDIKIDIGSSLF